VSRAGLIGVLLALVLIASSCGGTTSYSLGKTKACLVQRGAKIGGKLDFVATTASGGAMVANLGDNSVKIAFGQNDSDAEQIEEAYQRFAFKNVQAGLPDVLRRYNNAVTLWHLHPQDADLALVVGCLR
jgi:hypothetical protein